MFQSLSQYHNSSKEICEKTTFFISSNSFVGILISNIFFISLWGICHGVFFQFSRKFNMSLSIISGVLLTFPSTKSLFHSCTHSDQLLGSSPHHHCSSGVFLLLEIISDKSSYIVSKIVLSDLGFFFISFCNLVSTPPTSLVYISPNLFSNFIIISLKFLWVFAFERVLII